MEKDLPLWSKVGLQLFISCGSHPFHYAKVLIQIGHEPIEPWQTTTFFGKPKLALPSLFQYIRYIKSVDGFCGLYQGLLPEICADIISATVYEKSMKHIKFENEVDNNVATDDLEDKERTTKYIQDFLKNLISKTVALIFSHPFHVISVRMMAQFVGGEKKYTTIIGSFAEIYKENGISGFFAGIVPKFIAYMSILATVSTSTYIINKYFIQDRELRVQTLPFATFLASTVMYPLVVVSENMVVNNCGLAAGEPPNMPIYSGWTDCWRHLSQTNQLKRGSTPYWRTYTGPYQTINGRLVVDKSRLYFKKLN